MSENELLKRVEQETEKLYFVACGGYCQPILRERKNDEEN